MQIDYKCNYTRKFFFFFFKTRKKILWLNFELPNQAVNVKYPACFSDQRQRSWFSRLPGDVPSGRKFSTPAQSHQPGERNLIFLVSPSPRVRQSCRWTPAWRTRKRGDDMVRCSSCWWHIPHSDAQWYFNMPRSRLNKSRWLWPQDTWYRIILLVMRLVKIYDFFFFFFALEVRWRVYRGGLSIAKVNDTVVVLRIDSGLVFQLDFVLWHWCSWNLFGDQGCKV